MIITTPATAAAVNSIKQEFRTLYMVSGLKILILGVDMRIRSAAEMGIGSVVLPCTTLEMCTILMITLPVLEFG